MNLLDMLRDYLAAAFLTFVFCVIHDAVGAGWERHIRAKHPGWRMIQVNAVLRLLAWWAIWCIWLSKLVMWPFFFVQGLRKATANG